ncbi:acetyltransferase (GNAT) family protein [Chitinophaga skermanii]|uniref:Acetyltransferase (GNAT) family protein n=1 Tax=Chitinophaga skermanii TaxID=331697 RepID=A0A327Q7D5_9BACT|nr:GNAT family N-acetyltransferase [Chitinophaga skermanii]RAJ00409.1 acetyltransferase (GNAT) family protein [Chitinophaga skermanii]
MKKAQYADKPLVIDILTQSFQHNLSVNYIIKKDGHPKRIEALMDYSCEMCYRFGDIFLSNDKKACALLLYPDKKKIVLHLDLQLILRCVGIGNILKTLRREKIIHQAHPTSPFAYLWFVGVLPSEQGKGHGSELLQGILDYCDAQQRPIYLETSTERNLPWYERFGFEEYRRENLSYWVHFFRRNVR